MPKQAKLEWGHKRQRGGVWWIYYYRDGRQVPESTHSADEADADRLLKQRYAEIVLGVYQDRPSGEITMEHVIQFASDHYAAASPTGRISPRDASRCKILKAYWGVLRLSKFAERSMLLATGYVHHRKKQGKANSTINVEMATLRTGLKLARSFKLLSQDLELPPALDTSRNVRTGFWEDADFRRMLEALIPEWRPILWTGYWTGMRKQEVERLEWYQVDLINRTIRLEAATTKGKRVRSVPIFEELFQVLAVQRRLRDERFPECRWLFFRYGTGEQTHITHYSWLKACHELGWVVRRPEPPEQNRTYQRTGDELWLYRPAKHFHDFRRTAIRSWTRRGVPRNIAKSWSGHRTDSVFNRYDITDQTDLRWGRELVDSRVQAEREAEREAERQRGALSGNNDSTITAPPTGKPN